MKFFKGATRWVLVSRYLAFKIPSLHSWRLFLYGLLANMQEKQWSGLSDLLCPVLFSIPGGFLIVMPAVEPVPDSVSLDSLEELICSHQTISDMVLPIELKRNSFGVLKGNLVAIDYGS